MNSFKNLLNERSKLLSNDLPTSVPTLLANPQAGESHIGGIPKVEQTILSCSQQRAPPIGPSE